MFIAPKSLKGPLRSKERTNLGIAVRRCVRSFERSRRSSVTASYKHAARAPRKLDISDWVRVPVEKGSNQPLVPSVAAVRR
jgi:hypothetical protein